MSEDLRRVVQGALRQAIYDHGPITVDNLDSAAKRVNGAVRAALGKESFGTDDERELDHHTRGICEHYNRSGPRCTLTRDDS